MESLLKRLEPRREEKETILLRENEEVNEVLFFVSGIFVVGFELNKKSYYLIKFQKQNIIGEYNITFKKRAMFNYKSKTLCTGFFIRRSKWLELLDSGYDYIMPEFKEKIKTTYENLILKRLTYLKNGIIR